MFQVNSIQKHNSDFRSLLKELTEAITIPQFYHVLAQTEISFSAGFIDEEEFHIVCNAAAILDPVLFNRWQRGGE